MPGEHGRARPPSGRRGRGRRWTGGSTARSADREVKLTTATNTAVQHCAPITRRQAAARNPLHCGGQHQTSRLARSQPARAAETASGPVALCPTDSPKDARNHSTAVLNAPSTSLTARHDTDPLLRSRCRRRRPLLRFRPQGDSRLPQASRQPPTPRPPLSSELCLPFPSTCAPAPEAILSSPLPILKPSSPHLVMPTPKAKAKASAPHTRPAPPRILRGILSRHTAAQHEE